MNITEVIYAINKAIVKLHAIDGNSEARDGLLRAVGELSVLRIYAKTGGASDLLGALSDFMNDEK